MACTAEKKSDHLGLLSGATFIFYGVPQRGRKNLHPQLQESPEYSCLYRDLHALQAQHRHFL